MNSNAKKVWPSVVAFPVILAFLYLLVLNIIGIWGLLSLSAPHNPFDAGQTVEAYRVSRGMPSYEDVRTGHAPPFYGPVKPWLLGQYFRLFPVNNQAGKLFEFCFASLILLLMLRLFCKGKSWCPVGVGVALFLAINLRSDFYFVMNRPDMTALFFIFLGLILCFRGLEENKRFNYGLGILFLTIAFFTKQTALLVCVVPALALILRRRDFSWGSLCVRAIPVFIFILVIGGLHFAFPFVYQAMITVLGGPKLQVARIRSFWGENKIIFTFPLKWIGETKGGLA